MAGERRILSVGAGVGLIAAAVVLVRSPFDSDLMDLPRYRPAPRQATPRISHAEQQRRKRASKMARLTAEPQPLKHMHASARRRAMETSDHA